MGIKKLKEMNIALVVKLGWRIITSPNQLWAKVLWHKYGSSLAIVQKKGNFSHVWRGIVDRVMYLRRVWTKEHYIMEE